MLGKGDIGVEASTIIKHVLYVTGLKHNLLTLVNFVTRDTRLTLNFKIFKFAMKTLVRWSSQVRGSITFISSIFIIISL